MSRVAVIGAGISGVACARVLVDGGVDVVVFDRAKGTGGRLASQRLGERSADTGGQYATVSDAGFEAVMDDWLDRGIARPWATGFHSWVAGELRPPHEGAMRYAAPGGMRSLVLDLADGLDLRLDTTVRRVAAGPTVDGEAFDAVVLAMPDPQALQLLDDELMAERQALADRDWDAVISLTTKWSGRSWDIDGVFVNKDPVLSWIADDGARRGDAAAVLVSHSTGPFGYDHLDDPDAAAPAMLAKTREVLGITAEPVASNIHRWTFAKPADRRAEPFYLGPANIGICGDGWGAAKVETAWVSGNALARELAARLR